MNMNPATFILFSVLFVYLTDADSTILDISDFNFYFNTFHYDLTSTKQSISLNNGSSISLNIDLNDLTITVINDNHRDQSLLLNIIDDTDWNEVNIISSIDNYTKIHYEQYIAIQQPLTWYEAQSHCKKYYFGNLVSINSVSDNAVISKLCQMIPNNSNDNNECWIGTKYPHSKWQNNQPVKFDNFETPTQNNDDAKSYALLQVNDGNMTWTSTACDKQKAFICERSKLLYRSKYIGVSLQMDYEDAASYCLDKFGTKLAKYSEEYLEDAISACMDIANGAKCWIQGNGDDDECSVLEGDGLRKESADCLEENFILCERYNTFEAEKDAYDRRRLVAQQHHVVHHHHLHHPVHPMHGGMMHPMMMGGMNPMMGMGGMMNPMMMGGGMGMNPMMMGMGGMGMMNPMMMGMMGGMGGVHHVYDLHQGNMKKWRKKMRSMLRMMRDMHMMNPMMMGGMGMGMMNPMMMMGHGMGMHMNPMMMGHGGCHRHYGCNHHGHGMQHCVYFGMDLVCNAMMMPMMYPPMMGGLMPMGSGMAMNHGQNGQQQQPKKTMVVVHSKGAAPRVEHEMVDDETAKQIKNKGETHRRRMVDEVEDDTLQIAYSYDQAKMSVITKCKVLSDVFEGIGAYEICVNYNLDQMSFSLDVKNVYKKVLSHNERGAALQHMMEDRDVTDIADGNVFGEGNLVWFEPHKANLGYAVLKYELMDWHSIKGEERERKFEYHPHGKFNHFDHFVHYFGQFQFVYDSRERDEFCSGRLHGLPYKLCVGMMDRTDGILLYLHEDTNAVDVQNDHLYAMKQFVDAEFEHTVLEFDDDSDWNEIFSINLEDDSHRMKKCAYLTTTKVCIRQDASVYSVSIKAQSANKPN